MSESTQALSKVLANLLAKKGLQLIVSATKWKFLSFGPVGFVITSIAALFLERLLKETFLAGQLRLIESDVNAEAKEVRLILESFDPKTATPEEINAIDEKLKNAGRDLLAF